MKRNWFGHVGDLSRDSKNWRDPEINALAVFRWCSQDGEKLTSLFRMVFKIGMNKCLYEDALMDL